MMDSEQLLLEQKKQSIRRSKKELEETIAPLVSLADKEQLLQPDSILSAHERRLSDYRDRVRALLPPEPDASLAVGNLQRTEGAGSLSYISITSGHSIRAMEEDLLSLWRYKRFNGKDSPDMARLKHDLSTLTREFDRKVSFSGREEVRERCGEMEEKYNALILSCEHYLKGHQSPWSIAGRCRKSMAEKLLKAARAELDMLEDSALNCYEEIKAVNSSAGRVRLSWDEVLHNGRIRNIQSDREHFVMQRLSGGGNVAEIRYEGTGKREMLTVARDDEELKECRRVVAMSRLAEKLGLGHLAGAGGMNTRMTTMIINGKVVVGCITSGLEKTNLSVYRSENQQAGRPGGELLRQGKVTYGAEHIKDLLAMPFLDYLCGVKGRGAGNLSCDKTEESGGVSLGKIQATAHGLASGGFGTDVPDFPAMDDLWIHRDLADQILSLNANQVQKLLAGVLEEGEREAVAARLLSLQTSIREKLESQPGDGAHPGQQALPDSFKDDAALKSLIKNPAPLSAYADSQANGFHRLLDTRMASAKEGVREPDLRQEGSLMSLSRFTDLLTPPSGPNQEELSSIIGGLSDKLIQFAIKRKDSAPLEEGKDAVLREIDLLLEDVRGLRALCRTYLHQSGAPEDVPNRIVMGRLLQASDYQERLFRQHAADMCDWAGRLKNLHADRSFNFTYEDLFQEALLIAQGRGHTEEFDVQNLYQGVSFSEKELAGRIDAVSFEEVSEKLYQSLEERNKEGKKNSPEIMAVYEKLLSVMALRGRRITEGYDDFLAALNELSAACGSYIAKQEKHFTRGKLSGEGRKRLEFADDLQWELHAELKAFIGTRDDGSMFVRRDMIKRMVESCIQEGKAEADITFADLTLALMKNRLVFQEQSIVRGSSFRAGERRRERERKWAALEAEEKERKRARAGKAPEGFAEKPSALREKELEKEAGLPGFLGLSEKLDDMLGDRSRNSPEILAYADTLAEVVRLKQRPLFSPLICREYEERKASHGTLEPKIVLQSELANSLNELVRLLNELTGKRDAYLEKQNTRLLGGVISGQDRMDLMTDAYETGNWEYRAFCYEGKDGKLLLDYPKLMRYVDAMLSSGKPLEEISLTDLTNLARLAHAEQKGEEAARSLMQKRETTQSEEKEEALSLKQLSDTLNKSRGKKRFGRKDSDEFLAVADGLNALLQLKETGDAALIMPYYDRVIEACEAYEKKNAGRRAGERLLFVRQIKNQCTKERLGI